MISCDAFLLVELGYWIFQTSSCYFAADQQFLFVDLGDVGVVVEDLDVIFEYDRLLSLATLLHIALEELLDVALCLSEEVVSLECV